MLKYMQHERAFATKRILRPYHLSKQSGVPKYMKHE